MQIKEIIVALKKCIKTLKKRPDIEVKVCKIGRKTSKKELKSISHLPQDLIDLYAEMNGVHFQWDFIEPTGGGCIHIPTISEWNHFAGEEEHHMGFGDSFEAFLLDDIQPEASTWFVREKETEIIRIVFASAADGDNGIEPAKSITEYLQAAMKNGFVYYWPFCFQKNIAISYVDNETHITKFQLPPKKPAAIRAGVRIEFSFFSEKGRGEVLDIHLAEPNQETDFHGCSFALVKLDEGSTAWLPQKLMKAKKKLDAYERIRTNGFSNYTRQADLLDDIARAIGPWAGNSHYSFLEATCPTNARRAAGLLSKYSLTDAITSVIELYEDTKELSFTESRGLEKSGDEFSSRDFGRSPWEYTLKGVFNGLFCGILILAHHESFSKKKIGDAIVPTSLIERLKNIEGTKDLTSLLEKKVILNKPQWKSSSDESSLARDLGLPEDALLYLYTGF